MNSESLYHKFLRRFNLLTVPLQDRERVTVSLMITSGNGPLVPGTWRPAKPVKITEDALSFPQQCSACLSASAPQKRPLAGKLKRKVRSGFSALGCLFLGIIGGFLVGGEDIVLQYAGGVPYCTECTRGFHNSTRLRRLAVLMLVVAFLAPFFGMALFASSSELLQNLAGYGILALFPLSIAGLIIATSGRSASDAVRVEYFDESRISLQFGNDGYARLFLARYTASQPATTPESTSMPLRSASLEASNSAGDQATPALPTIADPDVLAAVERLTKNRG